MPSERDQTLPQSERLSRKIERLLSGQPSPVLDGDTEELADLAGLLAVHLDKAQPDPAFRDQLKQDLLAPGPRPVPFRPRPRPRRYPVPAFVGALTIVLVASAATGWMALDLRGSGINEDAVNQVARFATASPTAVASGSALMAASALAAEERREDGPESAALDEDFMTQPAPSGEVSGTSAPPETDAGPPAIGGEASDTGDSSLRAVVDLPPVDARHVELGALATVAASASARPSDVRLTLETDLAGVELDETGHAYYFSAPFVDSKMILQSVGTFLGVETEVDRREQAGRTIYSLTSPEGEASFIWSPDSGAFACTLPEAHSVADIENLSTSAIEWLKAFGFPADVSKTNPVIETREDGQRYVHVPLGNLPDPAIGHPMRITLVVDADGRIVSVSGYWLKVTRQTEVSIVSAKQAWDLVVAGAGYWPQGTEPSGSGEFLARDFDITYMLTTGGVQQDLALQPVIAISGIFQSDDGGEPHEATVYVQGVPAI